MHDLHMQIADVLTRISGLQDELRALDAELKRHLSQEPRCQQLDEICMHLEQLEKLGGADIFREATGSDPEVQLQHMRSYIAEFRSKSGAIGQAKNTLLANIKAGHDALFLLKKQHKQLADQEKRSERASVPAQLLRDMPYRNLPWSTFGEDELRFRRVFTSLMIVVFVFGGLVQYFKEPVDQTKGIVVPERIARIIKKKQEAKQEEQQKKLELAAKKAAEKAAAEKAAERQAKKSDGKSAEKTPTVAASSADVASTRKSAETKGVLAFKSDLANLLEDTSMPKMGSEAKISVKAQQASGGSTQRSLIVSQSVPGAGGIGGAELDSRSIRGSGGIGTSTLNRQITGTRAQRITDDTVKFSRVETKAIAGDSGERRLSGGSGPSRTDEEIQIVFDRYKSALYRMYNRELRANSSLRGSMVLRLVIEPDGSVSDCTIKSNELNAPEFSAEIVKRVLSFNFGEKAGVPATTILYPIEFLPPN